MEVTDLCCWLFVSVCQGLWNEFWLVQILDLRVGRLGLLVSQIRGGGCCKSENAQEESLGELHV